MAHPPVVPFVSNLCACGLACQGADGAASGRLFTAAGKWPL